jgi:hypothetical protein
MTDMPVTPEIPQPRKGANWKVIIPVAIAVVLCCICLVVVGVLAYMGTQGTGPLSMLASATPTPTRTPMPSATPTVELSIVGDWDVYYDWNCTGTYAGPVLITFFYDQTFVLTEDTSSGYGMWSLAGNYLDFIFNDTPYAHYVGTVDYSYTYLEGTMDTTDGSSGCWYGTIR